VGNLLENIENHIKKTTYSDAYFMKSAAYFVLSSIVGRKAFIRKSYATIYPNLWVLLIGPSSISHKSTILDQATDLIYNSHPSVIMANMSTPEGLIQELSEQPDNHGVMVKDEFGGILANMNREYMNNMKDLLMELYDSARKIKRRLRSETIEIHTPYVTWLTATTPARFLTAFKYDDIYTGFLNRFVICNYKPDRVTKYTEPNMYQLGMEKTDLLLQLMDLKNKLETVNYVEYILADDANELYKKYQQERIDKAMYDHELAVISRYFFNILKLSILNAIASDTTLTNKTITLENIQDAIKTMDTLTESALELINLLQLNPTVTRIYNIIKQSGIILHSDLLKQSRLLNNELNNIINTLISLKVVKIIRCNKDEDEKCYQIIKEI